MLGILTKEIPVPLGLFLDEPTSGLDSTSALKVIRILRSISRIGLTVAAVIHQPRIEIFENFDDVLLIAPGGRTAYFGPINNVKPYFESLGFNFNSQLNLADELMDILSGRGFAPSTSLATNSLSIVNHWNHHITTDLKEIVKSYAGVEMDVAAIKTMKTIVKSRGSTFLAQVWRSHMRSLNQQSRLWGAIIVEMLVSTLAGLVMGVAGMSAKEMYHGVFITPYRYLSSAPNEWFLGLCTLIFKTMA
jgi:ABC-type multidrug transport system ATPase subunit